MTSGTGTSAFPIVGVGASAGGLESIERLFRAMSPRPGVAFVVVQHLAPDFKSLMEELMGRFTQLPIEKAGDGMMVRPDHIYLLPPGKELEIHDGLLKLFERDPSAGFTLPIDRFLSSLAADVAERAVAVILSGSGSDGSRGAKLVHDGGGIVLVEDPATAKFDGMPRAAIDAGIADAVLPADAIATAITDRVVEGEPPARGAEADLVAHAISLLRTALGIDFAQYKLPTVLRRIKRRLMLRQLPDLEAYVQRLQSDPEELAALGHDLLIGVTRFYRDPATWEFLESQVFPELVAAATPERGVRAWVAGCATGEEAYSVAMALLDASAKRKDVLVKVFATDVHRRALESAGQGIYDRESLTNVDESRLRRFFSALPDGRFQVIERLRHAVVFAPHNILKDAPFTQLDFVSCRNLLIYFRPPAQRQALSLLQYGLRIGGILTLGPSENLADLADDFGPVEESMRVFKKTRQPRRILDLSVVRTSTGTPVRQRGTSEDRNLLNLYDAVLDRVMPPAILVSSERAVIDCFAGAEEFLQVAARRPSKDVVDLVPESARLALAGAIARASRERAPVAFEGIEWPRGEEAHRVNLVVDPILEGDAVRVRAFLITIKSDSVAPSSVLSVAPPPTAGDLTSTRFLALEEELKQTKDNLRATMEELDTHSEEMQATNEELVASNEELQSTNEELHSVNEELHTVNAELQAKIHELSEVNRDMRRLFESIDVALVFLDGDLRIRRFTPRAAELFGLLDHDVGRPLASFQHPFKRQSLIEDVAAGRDGKTVQYETDDVHGRTYLVRVSPYGGANEGVVVSATDLTALTAARRRVDHLSAIVASGADAIVALDRDNTITAWNDAATKLYGFSEQEAMGRSLSLIVPNELTTELDEALAKVWSGGTVTLETTRCHRDRTPIDVSTTISPLRDREGHIVGVSKIDRDIRERKRREATMAERERRVVDLYENSPDIFMSVDLESGALVEFNETMCRTLGYSRDELGAMHLQDLYPDTLRSDVRSMTERIQNDGEVRDIELSWKCKNGTLLEVSINSTGLRDGSGRVRRTRSVVRDVTQKKRAASALAEALRMRERFLAIVSHELRTPLYAVRTAADILADRRADEGAQQRALDVLGRQTAQMNRLLDDLLDVARITQDRFELQRTALDLRDSMKAAVEACALATDGQVKIVYNGCEDALGMIGDPARLQQAITNLLTNAIRHSVPGGKVHVDASRDGDSVKLSVRDEGTGIDPTKLGAIFDLFSSREGGTGKSAGLGLGLSVARRIVEGHGGTIAAESEGRNTGATFTVRLPLVPLEAERAPEPRKPGKLRLVIVEDQPDSLEMATLLLQMRGHEVAPADTGAAGIEAILREKPHLALVDIGLPDMSGYEVARQVIEKLGHSVPLIALTGFGQPDDIRRSREAGFRRHLTKPLDPDLLERVIADTVGASKHAEAE